MCAEHIVPGDATLTLTFAAIGRVSVVPWHAGLAVRTGAMNIDRFQKAGCRTPPCQTGDFKEVSPGLRRVKRHLPTQSPVCHSRHWP
ncbi:hypothetical protein EYF80_044532 [Liparis tanakae]|uniref:Uncharacterized protein n=1 Tax=Liparis tanakae TaxID=230148 RepID=A0A4Z2FWH6_9TELE|nr:hypothetical protein EYF80_044532 [Liparis tanakae]